MTGLQFNHHQLHLRVRLGSANMPTSVTWVLYSQGRTPYKARDLGQARNHLQLKALLIKQTRDSAVTPYLHSLMHPLYP